MRVSIQKPNVMVIVKRENTTNIKLSDVITDQKENFRYLGSEDKSYVDTELGIDARNQNINKVYYPLKRTIILRQ